MILGSHNSQTFLSFLQLVQEHLRRTRLGFTNVIVLDNVGLHKVEDIFEEFPTINTDIAVGPQQFVATKISSLPANVSHNTQRALNELPHDVSNSMNQSDGNVKCWALSPNLERCQFNTLIPTQVIPQSQTSYEACHCATPGGLVAFLV
ncbi:hypothetical protein DSO57_1034243 [Entomophthora muscae]|uniref:Uncharacterized protein n=1 Tax=Entomophthora muscae TaxID=34485 RepID=A0ACC2UL83_9FUNG|nr:hypothetical protein DSO57_1034243 [Entomophthora muscae]